MKIKLSEKDLKKSYRLLDTKEINISIADLLFYTFDDNKFFKGVNDPTFYFEKLVEFWNINPEDKEDYSILKKWVKPVIFPAKEDFFYQNSYFNNVKPNPIKSNGYELKYLSFKSYQPFSLDEIIVDNNDYYLERSPISYFTIEQKYLALSYKDEVWMSITPNEINTMKPYIESSKGDVLVFGLGLGYYPYMISLKDDVKNITIIELDKNIIDLFNKYIFPFFPHKEKIKIIQDDALSYLANNKKHYDTVFADLWHNPVDGLPLYIKLKNLEKDKNTNYQYWLEKSLIALTRRCLLTIYEEALKGYNDKDYLKNDNPIDTIINSLYFKTKNITINNYDDIYNLLSDSNIIKIICSLN